MAFKLPQDPILDPPKPGQAAPAEPVASTERRVAALERYAILDTPREDEFNEIAELAAQICQVPVALVSLVDAERQWFKAETGFGQRQTPLEQSICRYALAEDEILEIADTRLDPRSNANTLVTGEPNVRFYAGAVLRAADGTAFGTVCVLDKVPRTLTVVQRNTLRVLARQVVRELELRLALRQQDMLRREIDHRVKNQLQSIASFVRLKSARAPDPAVREALDTVQHRVSAAALLHEELYTLDADDLIALDRYLEKLCRLIAGSAPEGVGLEVEVEPVRVSAMQASALAAIVNEFVTNAFKHAFPDGRPGSVRVRATQDGGSLSLVLADDGVGSDGPLSGKGIGMRIMEAAAAQLEGRLSVDAGATGVRLSLSMPLAPPAQAIMPPAG